MRIGERCQTVADYERAVSEIEPGIQGDSLRAGVILLVASKPEIGQVIGLQPVTRAALTCAGAGRPGFCAGSVPSARSSPGTALADQPRGRSLLGTMNVPLPREIRA